MDLTQAVPLSFVFETIGGIFLIVAVGIAAVKRAKKIKETK